MIRNRPAPTVTASQSKGDEVAGTKEQRIAGLGLFADCRPTDIEWIARIADEVDLPPNTRLAREGAVSKEFVVVEDGTAIVRDGGADVILSPGSYFGERGVLEEAPHTHDISTRTRARLLVFDARAFRSLLYRVPSVGVRMLEEIAAADHAERSLRAAS
jgi:CRP-like cAMP-binding protein